MPLACIFVALNAIQIIYLSDSQDGDYFRHLPHLCVPLWKEEVPYPVLMPQRETRPYMVDLSIGQLTPDMELPEPTNTDTEDTYTTVDLGVPTGTADTEEEV